MSRAAVGRPGGGPALSMRVAVAMCAVCAGCGSTVRSTALATPDPGKAAFVLDGTRLAQLRAEAVRRCPQGFQVLRASESGERRGDPDDGPLRRWWTQQTEPLRPTAGSAQMMVLCLPAAAVSDSAATSRHDRPARAGGEAAAPADPGLPAAEAAVRGLPALAGVDLPPPARAPVTGYD